VLVLKAKLYLLGCPAWNEPGVTMVEERRIMVSAMPRFEKMRFSSKRNS